MTQPSAPAQERKIFVEGRGRYSLLDNQKVFYFDFPSASTLAQNYDVLDFLRNEVWKGMEAQKKQDEEKQKEQEGSKNDQTQS